MHKEKKRNFSCYIRKLGLKKKVVLFSVLIYIVTVLISFILFGVLQSYSRHKTSLEYVQSAQNEKADMFCDYFSALKNLTYNIAYSNWMQDICQNGGYTQRRQELLDNAHEFLNSLSVLYEGNQFAVITLNGTRVTSTESYKLDYNMNITDKKWYETLLKNGFYFEAASGKNKGIYRKHEEWDVTLYYVINDYNTLEKTGFFIITIPEKNLMRLLETEQNGLNFGLQCSDDRLLFSNTSDDNEKLKKIAERQLPFDVRKINDNNYASKMKFQIETLTWDLLTVFDMRDFMENNGILSFIFFFILLLTGFSLMIGAIVVSRYLTKPILDCVGAMGKIKENHFGILLPNMYTDEIGVLLKEFNEMSISLESLIEKNKAIVELQKESEIKLLENQINPHFLFNTLEIINSLILNRKEDEAVKVCEILGQLYRYNLRQEKWITLREELNYTRQYLYIAKYKINDLEFFLDVDENLMEMSFLKMVLQPLVENAIRHGFLYKTKDCCISIRIWMKSEKICIEVMDNGFGIEFTQLVILMKELKKIQQDPMQKLSKSTHIGLRNVVQRLYLEYGNDFEVNIITNPGDGLKVEMRIPIL